MLVDATAVPIAPVVHLGTDMREARIALNVAGRLAVVIAPGNSFEGSTGASHEIIYETSDCSDRRS